MKDSYEIFLEKFYISQNNIIDFGLNESIYIEEDKAQKCWNELKEKIENKEEIYIRGYGRDAKGTFIFSNLYKYIYDIDIKKDPTNNSKPQQLIQDLTGLTRNKDIRNYQVSHVFGKTKNPYCFLAPWNIVYVPKVIDPFTGHESKGELSNLYKQKFKEEVYNKYSSMIDEFNNLMEDKSILSKIQEYKDMLDNVNDYEEKFECPGTLQSYYKKNPKIKIENIKSHIDEEFQTIKIY